MTREPPPTPPSFTTCPDEEGIETRCPAGRSRCPAGFTTCPDEEGIETSKTRAIVRPATLMLHHVPRRRGDRNRRSARSWAARSGRHHVSRRWGVDTLTLPSGTCSSSRASPRCSRPRPRGGREPAGSADGFAVLAAARRSSSCGVRPWRWVTSLRAGQQSLSRAPLPRASFQGTVVFPSLGDAASTASRSSRSRRPLPKPRLSMSRTAIRASSMSAGRAVARSARMSSRSCGRWRSSRARTLSARRCPERATGTPRPGTISISSAAPAISGDPGGCEKQIDQDARAASSGRKEPNGGEAPRRFLLDHGQGRVTERL
jgi:hypothetical protein